MRTLLGPVYKLKGYLGLCDADATRSKKINRAHLGIESLETRQVCSAGGHTPAIADIHHHLRDIRSLPSPFTQNRRLRDPGISCSSREEEEASVVLIGASAKVPARQVVLCLRCFQFLWHTRCAHGRRDGFHRPQGSEELERHLVCFPFRGIWAATTISSETPEPISFSVRSSFE